MTKIDKNPLDESIEEAERHIKILDELISDVWLKKLNDEICIDYAENLLSALHMRNTREQVLFSLRQVKNENQQTQTRRVKWEAQA